MSRSVHMAFACMAPSSTESMAGCLVPAVNFGGCALNVANGSDEKVKRCDASSLV